MFLVNLDMEILILVRPDTHLVCHNLTIHFDWVSAYSFTWEMFLFERLGTSIRYRSLIQLIMSIGDINISMFYLVKVISVD